MVPAFENESGITIKKINGFPTEVKVKSPNGEETIYERGSVVKIKWGPSDDADDADDADEVHVDGVSFTEMLNHACFGVIEEIDIYEGQVKFGLRTYYYSHFTIGDRKIRSVQKFLDISDRLWKAKCICTDDIFLSRENLEYYDLESIQEKHTIEDSSIIRWEYNLMDGKVKSGKLYTPKCTGNFILPYGVALCNVDNVRQANKDRAKIIDDPEMIRGIESL